MEVKPAGSIPWRALIPLSLTVMVAFGTILYGFSVFITAEAAGDEFTATVLSAAYGGSVIAGGLLAIPIGRRADRVGIRGIVATGGVLGGLGMAAFAAATAPWQVIAAWWGLLGAAGAMMFYEVAFVAVDQWCSPQQRARALGVLTLIGGLAGIVFIPLTQRLVDAFGWRPTALGLGVLMTVTALAASGLALRRVPARQVAAVPTSGPVTRLSGLLRDRRFVIHTAAMMLTFFAAQGVIAHRVALFDEAGFDIGVVALWAAAASAISLPGRWLAPLIATRFRAANVQAVTAGMMAIAALLMVDGSAAWHLAGHFTLFGAAFGAVLPLRAMTMANWYSGARYGSIMGTQWTVTTIVGASGPFVVGLMRDAAGGYGTAAVALVAALLTGSILLAISARLPG
jgi:predicted MFS family arabinose efflux permease